MNGWSTEWQTSQEFTTEWPKEPKNKVPTHDPYTNPNAHIYFECSCGKILDPGTKSFAALTTHAGKMGWKIRFGQQYYIAYCNDCGKGIE